MARSTRSAALSNGLCVSAAFFTIEMMSANALLRRNSNARCRFTEPNLQRAFELRRNKALADIISMVKNAADTQSPLLNAAERVDRAIQKITNAQTFTKDQLV